MSLSDYTIGLGLDAKARTEVRLNEIKANLFIQPRGHHRSYIGVYAHSLARVDRAGGVASVSKLVHL